jgi:Ca2+-binding RTX toxin-like protein
MMHPLEPRRFFAAGANLEPDGTLFVQGTLKNDRVAVYLSDGGGGDVTIRAKVNGVTAVFPAAEVFKIVVDAKRGDDLVEVITLSFPIPQPITVWTHAGRDTIAGGDGPERLNAGDDDDLVTGGDGRDTIYGGPGPGADFLRGNGGSDLIDGEDGADTILGDSGNDNLSGGANADVLRGAAGNDAIRGNGGNDFISGGAGVDALFGDAGLDTILFSSADGDGIISNDSAELIDTATPT